MLQSYTHAADKLARAIKEVMCIRFTRADLCREAAHDNCRLATLLKVLMKGLIRPMRGLADRRSCVCPIAVG